MNGHLLKNKLGRVVCAFTSHKGDWNEYVDKENTCTRCGYTRDSMERTINKLVTATLPVGLGEEQYKGMEYIMLIAYWNGASKELDRGVERLHDMTIVCVVHVTIITLLAVTFSLW